MEKDELNKILIEHIEWTEGRGGRQADLSEANLRQADLSEANLRWADLAVANLTGADLAVANLTGANLRQADLRQANLRWADLAVANLTGANLRQADLRQANLTRANLTGADLPSPTILLLADWGEVSDKLCTKLMRYDASNHPEPSKFDDWAKGGECPYTDSHWERAANFKEKKELWKAGEAKSALELVMMLFNEKNIKR